MKLLARFNLMAMGLVTAVAMALTVVGTVAVSRMCTSRATDVMSLQLEQIRQQLDRDHRMLSRHGLGDVESYVASTQHRTLEWLSHVKVGSSGCALVLTDSHRIVWHVLGRSGDPLSMTVLRSEKAGAVGVAEYTIGNERRLMTFRRFAPWEWTYGVSMTMSEVYAERTRYWVWIVATIVPLWLMTVLAVHLGLRDIVSRISSLISCVQSLGVGRMSARTACDERGDELGVLCHSVNAMAGELEESLDGLHRDVAEAETREAQLRITLSDLEKRVDERTCDLAVANVQLESEVERQRNLRVDLQVSEERFRTMADALPEVVYEMDLTGQVTYVNRAAYHVLNGNVENRERIGNALDMLIESDRPRAMDAMKSVLAGESMQAHRYTMLRRDGTTYPAEIRSTRIVRDGVVTGIRGIVLDLTERSRVDSELAEARQTVEQAGSVRSAFLAGISHELRTPMNGVLGMARMLASTRLTDEQREYLEIVQRSSMNLMSLLDDIQDFTKISTGELELESVEFDLWEVLVDAMRTVSSRAHEKKLDLCYDISDDVPLRIVGDPNRLRQVLVNLIGNAVKFTERGEVRVVVRTETVWSSQVRLKVSVEDTGVGIDTEMQRRIFEMFAQTDDSTMHQYDDVGLGLVIVRQLVRMMHGAIEVCSLPNQGSTFSFTAEFPCHSSEWSRTDDGTQGVLNGVSVLLAVESEVTSRLVRRLLKRWGAFVGVAENETQVIDLLETSRQRGRPFRLAVFDSGFGGESGGLRLAARVNPRNAVEMIPIVMLTTLGDRVRVAQESRSCCVIASALKPLRRSELLDAVQRSLSPNDSAHRNETLVSQVSRSGRIADVLLVEDNAINQRLAVRFLEKAGHHVTVAANGRSAIQAVQSHDYDCILMDVQMPEMDGYEATRAIREREGSVGKRTPIIAMTAHAMPGDSDRCIEAGMDDYISKPVDFDRLLEMIDAWVSKAMALAK